tara:strand:+ start:186 stop:521 length:336 start_codon:yes stop_codon:yes gene_type:complete
MGADLRKREGELWNTSCFLRRSEVCPFEMTVVVQVKYTNPVLIPQGLRTNVLSSAWDRHHRQWKEARESMLFGSGIEAGCLPAALHDRHASGCLFLDQIKREKGVWWMPWQ